MADVVVTEVDREPAELVGWTDPVGLGVGFMVPIFRQRLRNARLVQTLAAAGMRVGFEPSDFQDTPLLDIEPTLVEARGDPYFAFAFGGRLIIGNDADARHRLSELLDGALSALPFLACEVSEFLGLDDRRDEFASMAFERLRTVSRRAADEWRDVCVFTEDVREGLLARFGLNAHWPRKILANIEGKAVLIQGLQELPSKVASQNIRQAVAEALRRMPRLYQGLNEFVLAFAPPVREVNRRFKARLIVDREFDIDLLRWQLRRAARAEIDLVGWDSEHAFSWKDEKPTSLLLKGVQLDHLLEAAERAGSRNLVAIAYQFDSKSPLPDKFEMPKNVVGFIDLPLTSETGSDTANVGNTSAVFAAAEIATATLTGRYRMPHTRSALLVAGGVDHRDAALDAAKNYDQAWARELVPWSATHFFAIPTESRNFRTQAVLTSLFGGTQEMVSSIIGSDDEVSWPTSALVLPTTKRSDADFTRHCNNLSELMGTLGWTVRDAVGILPEFSLVGSQSSFQMRVAEPVRLADVEGLDNLRRIKLSRIRNLRVTCRATPRSIVRHLFLTKELAVNVRDLVALDPGTATVWSIIAVLLMRMKGGKANQYRSMFIAYVVKEAVTTERPDIDGLKAIMNALDSPQLGNGIYFLIERASLRAGNLRARVRLIARRPESPAGVETAPVATFVLQVTSEGPSLERSRAT